jgi:biopolymer transport protein ExbD
MKKAVAYFFTLLMIFLVSSIFLISCKAKQLPPNTNTEIVKQKDSSSHVQITDNSKAIIDSLFLVIGQIKTAKPECDSVAQLAVENFIKTLNTSKQSGDNGYKIKYNELLKRMELIIKVGATKNEVTTDFKGKEVFKYFKITPPPVIVKAPLPKWQLYLMIIGIGTILYFIIKLLFLIRKFTPA